MHENKGGRKIHLKVMIPWRSYCCKKCGLIKKIWSSQEPTN